MTHADATAIAAQTPNPRAPGAGGLPIPRTGIEAGFFVAIARREGVFSFWAGSPDTTNGNVTMHWITEGGTELVYRQGETRCVLVSSVTSDTMSRMYANLEPCTYATLQVRTTLVLFMYAYDILHSTHPPLPPHTQGENGRRTARCRGERCSGKNS